MRYTRHIGYGFLLGTSMIMAAGMSVQADENEQTPIPVEDQVIIDDLVTEEIPADQVIESDPNTMTESETVTENVSLSSDTSNIEINNGIPVITLHIDESKGTIDAMNEDPKHNTYCYGTLDFTLPSDDFQYVDLPSNLKEYYNLEMSIKGRGNNTWTQDKKPYKIKLDKKADLLGLGDDEKNKH